MDAAQMNKLRWRCTRRALLEMDLLLGDFLENHFGELTPEQEQAFVELADMEDLALWPLITGKQQCTTATQAEVVALLRAARRQQQ